MELRHLRYFVAAAEERNISRASARLHVSQPAVSRQIQDLEAELGVTLFERESRGLRLTEAGETALVQARDILRRAQGLTAAMQAFARRGRSRSLRVGYIPTALTGFLASGLRAFNQAHPDVCVQIREMFPREQAAALREDRLDLALLGEPALEWKRDFRTSPILRVPLSAVLPDHHLLALRPSLDLAELAAEPFISLHESNFPGRPKLMAQLAERAGFIPDIRLKAEGFADLLGMVAGGAGVAVLPADVDTLPHPGVVFVKLRRPRLHLVSSAAWCQDHETPDLLELVLALQEASRLK